MPLKKDTSATYDKGTGKYKTVSEAQGERVVVAETGEPSGRVEQNTDPVTVESPVPYKAVDGASAEDKAVAPKKTARKSSK